MKQNENKAPDIHTMALKDAALVNLHGMENVIRIP
jgi:hypothetical protein